MPASNDDPVLLVRSAGEPWQVPAQVGYLGEADLQRMLADQPSLIPGVGPHALAAREFSTGVGPSDIVVVDQDGSVTVVECKLASNAEVRRKIVGQVLDYASRLWRMPLADFEARWKQCSAGSGVLDNLEDEATTALTLALDEGAFRLVLAVDEINEDLRRIVEFINAVTTEQVTVLALELRRVSHDGIDILTPRTFGGELARAKQDKAQREKRANWTIEDVRTRLTELDPTLTVAFDRLHDRLLALGCTALGTAAVQPSMIFRMQGPDGQVSWPYAIYTADTPTAQINFQWLAHERPEGREAFLDTLAEPPSGIDAATIRDSDYRKRPNVPLAMLTTDVAQAQLVLAVERLVQAG